MWSLAQIMGDKHFGSSFESPRAFFFTLSILVARRLVDLFS